MGCINTVTEDEGSNEGTQRCVVLSLYMLYVIHTDIFISCQNEAYNCDIYFNGQFFT